MFVRNWNKAEDCFCVDSGLTYPLTKPDTVITPTGHTGNIQVNTEDSVFTSDNVGDVIRVGGGVGIVTAYSGQTSLSVSLSTDITDVVNGVPIPQQSGEWSIVTPTTVVSGLNHLEGKTVSILADGSVVPPQVVTGGKITLVQEASMITVGLPFTCQLQTCYVDPIGSRQTVQGNRKNVTSTTIRMAKSRGMEVGSNKVDASTTESGADSDWTDMYEFKERTASVYAGNAIPLYTGDRRLNINSNWSTKGQVAVQQKYPLPANVLAIVSEVEFGDTVG